VAAGVVEGLVVASCDAVIENETDWVPTKRDMEIEAVAAAELDGDTEGASELEMEGVSAAEAEKDGETGAEAVIE
jgi:hypothetical protein